MKRDRNSVRRKIAALRQKLLQGGDWPESAGRLLADLVPMKPVNHNAIGEEEVMLALAVNDALEGIDITVRYPTFYRRMLSDHGLHQAFLELLETLEQSRQDTLEPVPESGYALTFLHKPAGKAAPKQIGPDRWQFAWFRMKDQLQTLFDLFSPTSEPAYRASESLEPEVVPLLRDQIQAADWTLNIWLEGQQSVEEPQFIRLSLLVLPVAPADTKSPLPAMQANLTWGAYQATMTLDDDGRASFPLLPLAAILDETGEVTAGLQVALEMTA